MKVFFYIHSLTGGGAERVTALVTRCLVDRGHEVGVITMSSQTRDVIPLDCRVQRLSLDLAGVRRGVGKLTINYRRWLLLRRLLKREKPDVVVAMMTTSIVLAILAVIGLQIRVYGSERNYPKRQPTRPLWGLLRRFVYRLADGHIAQTHESADWLQRHTRARNIHVVPNPVAWPIPSFSPMVAPESVLPPQRKIILAVGSKPEQKGFDLLIRAFAGLASDWEEWDLVIVGVDPTMTAVAADDVSLRQLSMDLGVVDRFYCPGRVGNVADWYSRADLFVLSSRYEGFPNVLLEAMASGCPCIAFDCDTGPRDLIEHAVNGLLVPAESAQELTAVMSSLLANEDFRLQLGRQAVAVRETFSEQRIMAHWNEILE